MIFLDSETCGLHGPICLFQYAIDDGEIILWNPWYETVNDTKNLYEMIANHKPGIVGFNLAFDWFHLYQQWTVLKLLQDNGFGDEILMDLIKEYAEFEPIGRDQDCLKPYSCSDLMLHARKGPYQSLMNRGDIVIRRVPTALAWQLAATLESKIKLKNIYFARRKDKTRKQWEVQDIDDLEGRTDPDFKNIVLRFEPSAALKTLAVDALGIKEEDIILFGDIDVADRYLPNELGYAPFAKAIGNRNNWKGAWPDVIKYHYVHWRISKNARKYAAKDVEYTRGLYNHFGRPALGDIDSDLACCVACVRWRGYKIDTEGIKKLAIKADDKKWHIRDNERKLIPTAPRAVKHYIGDVLDETERLVIKGSTKRVILEQISKSLTKDCDCTVPNQKAIIMDENSSYAEMLKMLENKNIDPECPKCKGTGKVKHPASFRAKEVLDARQADKEREMYEKLITAGRFHASFVVIGTLSSRMAGADDLNAQGIKNDKSIRRNFPFASGNLVLAGGDFAGFEVTLAEANYNDPQLRKDLLTCEACEGEISLDDFKCKNCGSTEGKAIHALFGVNVYPEMNYWEIKKTKGTPDDRYTRSKQAVFALFYGGEAYTLATRLGVPIDVAEEAVRLFGKKYPRFAIARQKIADMFKSMSQPGGIGTRVIWKEPADKIESMFGFPRYFTLENQICKTLFELANNPPKEWRDLKIKVRRRDRDQTVGGALQSALYGSAFQIQGSNTRAAQNHVIQSSGATITKTVQHSIWNHQPAGVHSWLVQPCNIHDEIMCPVHPSISEDVKKSVNVAVESFRSTVPLIRLDWNTKLNNWAEK